MDLKVLMTYIELLHDQGHIFDVLYWGRGFWGIVDSIIVIRKTDLPHQVPVKWYCNEMSN